KENILLYTVNKVLHLSKPALNTLDNPSNQKRIINRNKVSWIIFPDIIYNIPQIVSDLQTRKWILSKY
ncbi:MAG: hypothetical protein P8Y81_15540, partial [Ignavibacteriaceae bacterium]